MGRITFFVVAALMGLSLAALAQERLSDGELVAQADRLKTEIEAADQKVDEAKVALTAAEGAAKKDAQQAVDDAKAEYDGLVIRLKEVIGEMGDRKLDATSYKGFLIELGEIDMSTLDAKAALGLLGKWTQRAKDWFVEKGPGLALKILGFLLILFVFKVLAGVGGKITHRALRTSKLHVSDLLKSFFVNVVGKLIFIIGLLIAFSTLGIDIGPILAGVGVLGFVIGFALQGTLSNFAAGIMILLYRPYDVGDAINAAGITGKVDSMNLVSTTILTLDNQLVVIPNNSIWGGVITNITAKPKRRVDMVVGVGYDDDLDAAEKVIRETLEATPGVLEDPAPVVQVQTLNDSSVDFIVRPWCKTADYLKVHGAFTKAVKIALDKAGLSIPYPQRDIHIVSGAAQAIAS